MKVRIISENTEDVHDVPIREMSDYIKLLKEHGIIDVDGELCEVKEVVYDSMQHAFDISCESESK